MNTEERIESIIKDLSKLSEIDKVILRLELENLVTQAQLEELRKEK